MNVFISYGSATDQVTALRLQALAAVNGLTVYVPPIHTRQNSAKLLDAETTQKLRDSDVILGVIQSDLSDACNQELNSALSLKKDMIVMAGPAIAQQLQLPFGSSLVVIDAVNPDQAEKQIVQHLHSMKAQKSARVALLALVTLALGLLIFARAE